MKTFLCATGIGMLLASIFVGVLALTGHFSPGKRGGRTSMPSLWINTQSHEEALKVRDGLANSETTLQAILAETALVVEEHGFEASDLNLQSSCDENRIFVDFGFSHWDYSNETGRKRNNALALGYKNFLRKTFSRYELGPDDFFGP